MFFIAAFSSPAQLCSNERASALRLRGAWHALTAWKDVMARLVAQLPTWAASSFGHCPSTDSEAGQERLSYCGGGVHGMP